MAAMRLFWTNSILKGMTEELIHRCDRVAPVPVQSPTGIAKQQLENARRELAAKGHKVALSPKPSLPPPPHCETCLTSL
jgi:hypothetical protein